LEFEAADGARKWVRTIGNPEIKDGRVVRVAGSFQDITDRKKADMALRESEELFSTVFRVSPIAINIFRLSDGCSIKVNDGFTALSGFSRDEVLGHSAAELGLFPDGAARAALMKEMGDGGGARMSDARIRSKSGEMRDALVSINAVTLSGDRAAIVVATDITDRKRAEAEVKALHEQLIHSQKMEAVGRLAGGVAHDFNNLLQIINPYSERIEEDYASDPALLRYAKSIHQAGAIAANLTRQLLAFSRKAPAKTRTVELDAVLEGMEDMIRALVGDAIAVELSLNFPGRFMEVDPSQIEQIVMNLAVNARDAMPGGGVLRIATRRCTRCNESTAAETPGLIELAVSDSGCGMDAETRTRVFEPFFTTKPFGRGTGLGLSTVYGIVQHCGGSIELESQPGVGTEFRLLFPLVEAPQTRDALVVAAKIGRGSERILIVEDGDDLRDLYQDTLANLGYRVATAENGRVALDLISATGEAFDLVVSDTIMPVMGGIELLESLQRLRPGQKLLLLSGYAGGQVEHPATLPQVELLVKPFAMKVLAAKVRHLLDDVPVQSTP
jgi:PAS domain S-box-containing protein